MDLTITRYGWWLDQYGAEGSWEAGRMEGEKQLFRNHEKQRHREPVCISLVTAPRVDFQVTFYLSHGCVADWRGTDKAHEEHLPAINTNCAWNSSWGLAVEKPQELLYQWSWDSVTVYVAVLNTMTKTTKGRMPIWGSCSRERDQTARGGMAGDGQSRS